MESFKQLKRNWVVIIVCLAIGGFFGFLINDATMQIPQQLETKPLKLVDPQYELINPLLGYDNAEAVNYGELVTFKKALSKLVTKEINDKNASKISVYFRALNTGRWISLNEDEPYTPASLLKVPIMIAYYHLSETTPGLLNKRLVFNGKIDVDNEQTIQPSEKLVPGASYTVDELIDRMIKYSDNNSTELLLQNIDSSVMSKVFSDMNILLPNNGAAQDFMYIKNYAIFFRVLYASTYLNHADSEKALELLNESTFRDGIASPVPENQSVAHKFGEYGLIDPTTNAVTKREFHDCGIIYYPKHPYLLCIMTQGDDLNKLEKSVNDISDYIYSEFVKKAK
jgi:beta-lactamase class A